MWFPFSGGMSRTHPRALVRVVHAPSLSLGKQRGVCAQSGGWALAWHRAPSREGRLATGLVVVAVIVVIVGLLSRPALWQAVSS